MNASQSTYLAQAIGRALRSRAAVLSIAALIAHGSVEAQNAPASGDDIETVLVTGIRAGIEDAIELGPRLLPVLPASRARKTIEV